MLQHRWLRWGVYFVVWSMIGVVYSLHLYLVKHDSSIENPWIVLWWGMPDVYIWAVLAIFMLPILRRLPLQPQHLGQNLMIYLVFSGFFAAAHLFISLALDMMLYAEPFAERLYFFFRVQFIENIIYYWMMLFLYNAWQYYHKYQDRKVQASQLETQLANAQVKALKMQLNPHFLFNTLNAISALVEDQPKSARTMLARLSDLLRHTLDSGSRQQQTLKEELEFIRLYLNIESVRFSDRLQVAYDISPQTQEMSIPSLILQPLVENSIVHGIANRAENGKVIIRSLIQDHHLILEVWDNGHDLKSFRANGRATGIGLSNTRQRLKHLYGEAGHIDLKRENDGTLVTLTIPIQTTDLISSHEQQDHESADRRRRVVGQEAHPFPAEA